jgi:flagellar assembly factor FliW
MLVKTKYFGEVDLGDDKILTFDDGIFGFEDSKKWTILYDSDDGGERVISWFQSVDDENLALPVIYPNLVKEDYNPTIEDEWLAPLGELNDDNILILLTLTVPADIEQMRCNMKAPIVINADTRKGVQLIAENEDYPIRYNVYEHFRAAKKSGGVE